MHVASACNGFFSPVHPSRDHAASRTGRSTLRASVDVPRRMAAGLHQRPVSSRRAREMPTLQQLQPQLLPQRPDMLQWLASPLLSDWYVLSAMRCSFANLLVATY
jgi:hypothetical protein